jgi:hypothetical protein
MKLITEQCEEYEITTLLEEGTGNKRMFIEGIFMQGNKVNRNGRFYPTDMLNEKVESYKKNYVDQKRAYGELGHPKTPVVNGDRICMRITELKRDDNNFIGKAQISNTPMGKIVEGIIGDGGRMAVSSRGVGTVVSKKGLNEVQGNYMISAVDVVTDPSAQDAFVNGIMENVEWIFNENIGGWQAVELAEQTQKKMRAMTIEQIEEHKLSMLQSFLNSLK